MKRTVISVIMAIVLCLGTAACGGGNTATGGAAQEPATPAQTPQQATPEQTPQEQATQEPTPAVSATPEPPSHTHTWREANYQEPKTCTECQETEGEPIPPGFLSSGFVLGSLDTVYDYKTMTFRDITLPIVSQITASDYRVFESDDEHPAKEGYEWRVVRVDMENNSEAGVQENGIRVRCFMDLDYYDFNLEGMKTDFNELGDSGSDTEYRSVNFRGEDYEIEYKTELLRDEWIDKVVDGAWVGWTYYAEREFAFCVPTGYDGLLIVFYNGGNYGEGGAEMPKAELLDEDSVWFRLD